MKKGLYIFLSITFQLTSGYLIAQNWVNGGNALADNGMFRTITNFSVLFKPNNSAMNVLIIN